MNVTKIMNVSSAGLALAIILSASAAQAQFSTQWQLGASERGWPIDGVGGGPDVDFYAENGTINPLPGSPTSALVDRTNDNDYYFAGTYNGLNSLNATVPTDELGMERAFAGADNLMRIHFNLPASLNDADMFRFTFEPSNLHGGQADSRYGASVNFNGVEIQPQVIIRPADLMNVYTSVEFTAGDVGAIGGSGGDNIIEVVGYNYNADGGGNWMGLDHYQLEFEAAIPEPTTLTMLALASLLLLPLTRRKRSQK